ncbi:acyl-CoA dehydratase activase [Desulfobacterales bacterium HSG16]|nr:acyl-CoA dehydratase activase [Desulfobacterales bacterium HSG16]
MDTRKTVLGIDIGSVSICLAQISQDCRIIKTAYGFHKGDIPQTIRKLLADFDLKSVSATATTVSTPSTIRSFTSYDNRVATIAAVRYFYKEDHPESILIIGGEKFGLISFDKNHDYLNYKANTSCAAGTGSFLDQQAGRLNIASIGKLSDIAFSNTGKIPKIASRCAVFAKTDLIHAQQEGYGLDEISDGLCYGLARNVVDTLFGGDKPGGTVLFCGGVAKNQAVANHISQLIGTDVLVNEYSHMLGAIGAGLEYLKEVEEGSELDHQSFEIESTEDILLETSGEKKLYYDSLELRLSEYPDFESLDKYEYKVADQTQPRTVEVDIYEALESGDIRLGIDIGSTSTKAVITDSEMKVLAGFYTRTAGRPVEAIQDIFEAIDNMMVKHSIDLNVIAAGTTGSGRKFVGKMIGASIIVDEITAHARAAYELNPEVDTIIEIGGQDAKFTTLQNGRVTTSIMNNVCAAGTGSFIEEQAVKLGCPLLDYSARTEGVKAPMSSDRCTVFMERDLNHYLSEGYAVNEVLASVLHSVRENYLIKVASESSIGNNIFFQGATAKNKALVAAFEQRLEKPILVSKFCHLTGALGAALILADEKIADSSFRGIDIYKKKIPIHSEVCGLCNNNCKITTANIEDETVAYGFLCGRDYDTQKFVNNNKAGFDLIRERKKQFSFTPKKESRKEITIGIPAALHLHEDIPLWKKFFDLLSIKTITSEKCKEAVKTGKQISGAEFCAPMNAMHGHVSYLLDEADYVFVPFYLEEKRKEKGGRRQYCYYTQFMPALAANLGKDKKDKILTPVLKYLYTGFHTRIQLYNLLKNILPQFPSFFEVSAAYDKAVEFKAEAQNKLKKIFKDHKKSDDIRVVFLGRPYTVLSPSMNNHIPDIFASMGIKTFYQDMLDYTKADVEPVAPLLEELHWKYAADILEAAHVVSKTKGIYPVLVTSFKCAPDSFVTQYFKMIMEASDKPYLILELGEHDSSVGFETRIESAARSFTNHHLTQKPSKPAIFRPVNPSLDSGFSRKNIVLPNWDPITCRFLAATLEREGYNTILMNETALSIRKSLKFNTGQCIPLNAIAQGFVDTIETHNLNPAETSLWMTESELACNIKLYPHHIKTLLYDYGNGLEKAGVFSGELSLREVSVRASINAYFSFMFGGLLRNMACKIRPYELEKGKTDRVLQKSVKILVDAFSGKRSKEDAISEVVSHFEWIDTRDEQWPKVAIFGDMYVRDNDVMNQDLIHFIEQNRGEVITTPYSHYAKMIAGTYFKKWFKEGKYMSLLSYRTLLATMTRLEKTYYKYFERVLHETDHEFDEESEKILSKYRIEVENTGESMDNILKIFYIKKHYPDVSLFVQTAPAFCCPSLITEAMSKEIEQYTGVPVVCITYDGTGGNKNDSIIPYLKFPRKAYGEDKIRLAKIS